MINWLKFNDSQHFLCLWILGATFFASNSIALQCVGALGTAKTWSCSCLTTVVKMTVISLCFCPGVQVFLDLFQRMCQVVTSVEKPLEYFFFFFLPVCECTCPLLLDRNFHPLLNFMVSLQDRISIWVSPEAVWSLSNSCYWCVFLNVSSTSTGRSSWHHFGSICRGWH